MIDQMLKLFLEYLNARLRQKKIIKVYTWWQKWCKKCMKWQQFQGNEELTSEFDVSTGT